MVSAYGKITAEGVENIRSRIGAYYGGGQTVRALTKDILIHAALDHGIRNPLFFDDEYGRKTRYGSMIGLPMALQHVQNVSGTQVGGLPGVQAFYLGSDWEFYHVIRPDDQIGATYRPFSVEEKAGQYAGNMVFVHATGIYMNQRDEVVGRFVSGSARTERSSAAKRGKYLKDTEKTKYTEEQLQEIQSLSDSVELRGAIPRFWEDVHVGDELSPLVKGPLRKADIAFYGPGPGDHRGVGAFTTGAHWYVLKDFMKHPGYAAGETKGGRGEHPHAGHWGTEMAKALAVPGVYDLGSQRGRWMMEMVLNWIGDDAFLRRHYYELRRFNLEGDITYVRGKVSGKWIEGRRHVIKCDVSCQDQRDKVTAQGYAEAILPSRYPGFEVPM
ncbi:MaoC family dehydratase N-terminal domain-containing protein [Chloroflexota bacterium]